MENSNFTLITTFKHNSPAPQQLFSLYIYIYIYYIHTRVHTHILVHIYTDPLYIHLGLWFLFTNFVICAHISNAYSLYICIQKNICWRYQCQIFICVLNIYIYICMYIKCVCIYIYIYIYICVCVCVIPLLYCTFSWQILMPQKNLRALFYCSFSWRIQISHL